MFNRTMKGGDLMHRYRDLLSERDAIDMFCESGRRVTEHVQCSQAGLERILRGGRAPNGLSDAERDVVAAHRRVLNMIHRARRSWLIEVYAPDLLRAHSDDQRESTNARRREEAPTSDIQATPQRKWRVKQRYEGAHLIEGAD
jgi:hypothetical protein